jgi:hypothetical protein
VYDEANTDKVPTKALNASGSRMSYETMTKTFDKNFRDTLIRLSTEISDGLEDLRYHLQRHERRRVTKREIVERALSEFIARQGSR